jgi:hypothetical protein
MAYTIIASQSKNKKKIWKRHLYKRFEITTSSDGCVGEIYVPSTLAPAITNYHLDIVCTLHAGLS